jgi:hypothetical protein
MEDITPFGMHEALDNTTNKAATPVERDIFGDIPF